MKDVNLNVDGQIHTPFRGNIIGVQGDNNVNHINFKMPRYYNGLIPTPEIRNSIMEEILLLKERVTLLENG